MRKAMSASSRIRECDTARTEAASSALTLSQKRFDLFEVVPVVAGHGFEDFLQRHVAAFRVVEGFIEILWLQACEKSEIPLPHRREDAQRHARIVVSVSGRKFVLIERLDHVVIFRQRLAQPEGEDYFAIGEMSHDVTNAPLARRRRKLKFLGTESLQ